MLVIDTRNRYEFEVGTFPRAIDPGTDSFRQFPDFARELAETSKDRPLAWRDLVTPPVVANLAAIAVALTGARALLPLARERLEKAGLWRGEYDGEKREWFARAVDLVRERFRTLNDFTTLGTPAFNYLPINRMMPPSFTLSRIVPRNRWCAMLSNSPVISALNIQLMFSFLHCSRSSCSALCWLWPGRKPWEKSWKIGSYTTPNMVATAFWTILSSSAVIPIGRFLPSSLSTQTRFTGVAAY